MDDFIKNSFIKLRNDSQLKNLIFLKILDTKGSKILKKVVLYVKSLIQNTIR